MFTEIERNYQIADFVKKTNLDTKYLGLQQIK